MQRQIKLQSSYLRGYKIVIIVAITSFFSSKGNIVFSFIRDPNYYHIASPEKTPTSGAINDIVDCGAPEFDLLNNVAAGKLSHDYNKGYRTYESRQSSNTDMYQKMIGSNEYESDEIVILSWNAELIKPTAEMIANKLKKIDLSLKSLLIIMMQENLRYTNREVLDFERGMIKHLNSNDGGAEGKWVKIISHSLNNLLGTKMKTIFKSNTQTIFSFRKNYFDNIIKDIEKCSLALKKGHVTSEKGYVGLSFLYKDYGRVAVVGTHFNTKNQASDLVEITKSIEKDCLKNQKGAIILVGDLNTRLGTAGLLQGYSKSPKKSTGKGNTTRDILKDLLEWTIESYNGNMNERKKYLWLADPLGGARLVGDPNSLSDIATQNGYTQMGVCYNGGFSYSFKKGGKSDKIIKGSNGIFNLLKENLKTSKELCKNSKGRDSCSTHIGVGFLDRVLIKQYDPFLALIPNNIFKHNKFNRLIISEAHQVYEFESDHLAIVWVLQWVARKK